MVENSIGVFTEKQVAEARRLCQAGEFLEMAHGVHGCDGCTLERHSLDFIQDRFSLLMCLSCHHHIA